MTTSNVDAVAVKPARPYSYYVATNFHPFDLSVLCKQLEERQEQEKLNAASSREKSPLVEIEPIRRESSIRLSKRGDNGSRKDNEAKKQACKKKQNKRLSTSLSDMKASNVQNKLIVNDDSRLNTKAANEAACEMLRVDRKSKSNQRVTKDEDAGKNESGEKIEKSPRRATLAIDNADIRRRSSSLFRRATAFTATMPHAFARSKNTIRLNQNQEELQQSCHEHQHQPASGKINRFFRHLFRVGANDCEYDDVDKKMLLLSKADQEVCRHFF